VRPMGEVVTRYHISLDVEDRPGVLAQVARVFAEQDVSIETVRQQLLPEREGQADDGARRAALVVVTHSAPDAALAATVDALAGLDVVAAVASVMRVEGES
jgi:homoserine dehydrogenase